IDGRLVRTRSEHSLVNALFQSAGVIFAKYTMVYMFEMLEDKGLCTSPFEGKPDCCSMIEMHDEAQLAVNSKYIKAKVFKTKEEAESFIEENVGGYKISNVEVSDKGL